MKKSSLLKMKNLPATEEMLAVAREDVPVKVGSGWNTSYRCRYSGFARSSVEGGILKVTLYDPDAMRLGGTLPVYEIFMEKEKQQFLTYDRAHDKWRTAKIDYLEWQAKGSNNVWISAVDDAQIRQYLVSDEKSVYRAKIVLKRRAKQLEGVAREQGEWESKEFRAAQGRKNHSAVVPAPENDMEKCRSGGTPKLFDRTVGVRTMQNGGQRNR